MSALRIRRMMRPEMKLALDWAAAEGWNPGLGDAESFLAADAGGFFLGCVGAEPVGCIGAVAYAPTFGFLGLHLVKPDRRGQGHGRALWRHGFEHLAPRNVGVEVAAARQDAYARRGFAAVHRTVRFGGEGVRAEEPEPRAGRIVSLASVSAREVGAFDRVVFPAVRDVFLGAWIAAKGTRAMGLLREGAFAGFGCLRPCRVGFKVGPLVAADEMAGEALFRALVAGLEEPVFLDAPDTNGAAFALAARHGLRALSETARMYLRPPARLDAQRCYAIASAELG